MEPELHNPQTNTTEQEIHDFAQSDPVFEDGSGGQRFVGRFHDWRIEVGAYVAATMLFGLGLLPLQSKEIVGTLGGTLLPFFSALLAAFFLSFILNKLMHFTLIDLDNAEILRSASLYKLGSGVDIHKHWSRPLEDTRNIQAVAVKPRRTPWNPHFGWYYPISLLTRSGKEIVFCNDELSRVDCDYSNSLAAYIGEALGCQVFLAEEETPQEFMGRRGAPSMRPVRDDVGLLGRLTAVSAAVVLFWGLWQLCP